MSLRKGVAEKEIVPVRVNASERCYVAVLCGLVVFHWREFAESCAYLAHDSDDRVDDGVVDLRGSVSLC